MIRKVYNKIKGIIEKIPQNIDDEYIDWLRFANAGMLHSGNIYCFDYAINNLPSNAPIIEIGSFCGLSTNVISYLLKKYHKSNRIITSDKWIFEGAENEDDLGNSDISHAAYREFVINSFKRNVKFFSSHNLPYPIKVISDDFFELWKNKRSVTDIFNRKITLGGKISFAYIDGNHSYEFVKRDFENTFEHLETKGFILFDDSSSNSDSGSAKLMKEVINNSKLKLIIKNPNYLFQKIK